MQANFVSKSFKFHNPPFKCYNSKMAKFSFPVFNSITSFKNSDFICFWISFVPSHFMVFVFGCNTRHSNVISLDKFLQAVSCRYSIYVRALSSWCLLSTGVSWFMNPCGRVTCTVNNYTQWYTAKILDENSLEMKSKIRTFFKLEQSNEKNEL